MVFRIHCIFQCGLLLAVMTLALPANLSSYVHKHERKKRDAVETSSCKQRIKKDGMSLFNDGIYNLTMINMTLKGDFFGSLKSVFDIMQKDRDVAKKRIEKGLEVSFRKTYNSLGEQIKNGKSLEATLVFMYTEDHIYGILNMALRNHNCTHKVLTPEDKNMAAYATALLATLLYWKDLRKFSETTFRVIRDIQNINVALQKYELHSSVVFPAFTSASKCLLLYMATSEKCIILKIDNSQHSLWSPKYIAKHSAYKSENETLYPSSAEFRVTSKPELMEYQRKKCYEIHLQLKGNGYSMTDEAIPIRGSGRLLFVPLLLAWMHSAGQFV